MAWSIRILEMAPTSKKLKVEECIKQTIQGPVKLILIDPISSFPANKEMQAEDD